MKIRLLCVGRMTESYLQEGCQEFTKRLQRYLTLTTEEFKEHKSGKKPDLPRIIAAEGDKLLQRIPADSFLVVLDERGKAFRSQQLADLMSEHMLSGSSNWTLVIGGPYGLSEAVRARADLLLSLSPMTLTHQLARLLLLEQLYRSCTIMRNEPYHH